MKTKSPESYASGKRGTHKKIKNLQRGIMFCKQSKKKCLPKIVKSLGRGA
jgi:hypothetical protein